jgi:hypothetical protein
MPDALSPQLIQHTEESYGPNFKADLFEQYKLYIESADKISERRVSANNYLLAVNSFLVALQGVFVANAHQGIWNILMPIVGILVALTWHRIIASYRNLNTVKFKIIHELEREMPAALYAHEWTMAEEGRGKTYHPLTHLERWIPLIFMGLYGILFVCGIWTCLTTSGGVDWLRRAL